MDELDNKIIKIKLARMKPEERYIYKIFNSTTEFHTDKYPNSIFYIKEKEILFEYQYLSGEFFFNYNMFFSVIKILFKLDYIKTKNVIEKMFSMCFKHNCIINNNLLNLPPHWWKNIII